MPLRTGDYKALLDLIELVYGIPDRRRMLLTLYERLDRVIPFSSVIFKGVDQVTGIPVPGHIGLNTTEPIFELFIKRFAVGHPGVRYSVRHPNRVCRVTDLVPAKKLAETTYGREFQPLGPIYYEMGVFMRTQGDLVGGLTLHRTRSDRDFSAREQEILGRLVPHLGRVLHTINVLEDDVRTFQDMGVIAVRNDGQVVYINEAAQEALNGRSVSAIPGGDGRTDAVLFRNGSNIFRVRTARREDRETVIFLEPIGASGPCETRFEHFGLTPRQREVARLALRRFSTREIAHTLGITEQTTKDHLHDVYDKLRIRNRREMQRVVEGSGKKR